MSSLTATKLDLSQPDKFQMASVVTKNSRTGITSNKRLLAIRKGYLYYYSNVPKKFKGDASILQTIHQLPKCSIQIVNIKQIKGFESNSSFFSIQFQAKNMLQRQDIRKTMTLQEYNFSPKNTKELIVWQFTCDNQFVKQRWVAALQGLQTHYNKEKKQIQKFFNQNKHLDHLSQKNSSSGGRNSQIPWRQSQSLNRKTDGVNYLQLVSSKSNDERQNMSSTSPQNKFTKSNNYLQVMNTQNSNSRSRNTSAVNQQQKKQDIFTNKQYSPNPSRINVKQVQSSRAVIIPSSSEQSLQNPKSSTQTKAYQNSPINNLSLSDAKTSSPVKQGKYSQDQSASKGGCQSAQMMFSKTQKFKVSQQTIQQDDTQNNKSPHQTPLKKVILQDSDSDSNQNKEADQFQMNIVNAQTNINKTHPSNLKVASPVIKKGLSVNKNKNEVLDSRIQIIVDDDVSMQAVSPALNMSPKKVSQQVNRSKQQGNSIKPYSIKKITEPVSISSQQIEAKSIYCLYEYLFSSSDLTFNKRLQVQRLFSRKIHQFSQKVTKFFISYVDSLSHEQNDLEHNHQFETLWKTNNFIVMRNSINKALFKIALVTTQMMRINEDDKIYYDEESIKNLKRQFKIYDDINRYVMFSHLKENRSFRLRVPLVTFVEYKGICALVMDESYANENEKADQSLNDTNRTANGGNTQLRKYYVNQIQALTKQGYQMKDFTFIQSSPQASNQYLIISLLPQVTLNRMCKQQYKTSYLKRILKTKRPQKHHNIQFIPPFTQQLIIKAKQSNASTSIQSLQQYVRTLQKIKQFKAICTKQQILQVLKICIFCKGLRKIYRAAQGEIQQTHFLNLILKKDPQIMKVLQMSSSEEIPELNGLFFTFLKYYLGIQCTTDHKQNMKNKENQKSLQSYTILSTAVQPKDLTFSLQKLQINELYKNLERYIADQALGKSIQTFEILDFLSRNDHHNSSHNNFDYPNLAYLRASVYLLQKDYLHCIELCKSIISKSHSKHSPHLINIYLLMIKAYSQFSYNQLHSALFKLIQITEYNYGPNSSTLISIYRVASYYIRQMSLREQYNIIKQKMQELSFKLLEQALKLTLKLFTEQSDQYIDIALDLAKLYEQKQSPKSKIFEDQARTIIISTQSKTKLFDYLSYQLRKHLTAKDFTKFQSTINELEDLMYVGKVKVDSSKLMALMRMKFEAGILSEKYSLCERAIEILWRSQRVQIKRQGIIMCSKLMKRLRLIPQLSESDDDYSYSRQGSMIDNGLSSQNNQVQMSEFILRSLLNDSDNSVQQQPLLSRLRQLVQEDQQLQNISKDKTNSYPDVDVESQPSIRKCLVSIS